MSSPVSAIITTYDRDDYLTQAIESVRSQTQPPREIIVVDGEYSETTEQIVNAVSDVPTSYLHQETDRGPHAGRSMGVKHATGEYIQFLDDDDQLLPEKLQQHTDYLNTHPDIGVVYCGVQLESGDTHQPNPEVSPDGDPMGAILRLASYPCIPSTMLIRRELLEEIRPFENTHGADDTGLKIELAQRTAFDYTDEPLVVRGEHDSQLSESRDFISGIDTLLARYDELYQQHPDAVRNEILAKRYTHLGNHLLEQHGWSVRSIVSFWKVLWYTPNIQPRNVIDAIGAVGGRPSRDALVKIGRRITE